MTTLAMFSGGLDSTAMLVKLLSESEEPLRVHHIHLRNAEGRDAAEGAAARAVVGYCRARYRAFHYSESALDFRGLAAIPIDYLSVAFVACQVAVDTPGCRHIAVGALGCDTDIDERAARQRHVFDEMYACSRARRLGEPAVDWVYPVYRASKAELAAELPPDLVALTWSCRRPVRVHGRDAPCGACKACLARQTIPGS